MSLSLYGCLPCKRFLTPFSLPAVRLVPCEPIEGEDLHLWAYLPMPAEEQLTIQDRIVAIEHAVQEQYGVQTVVVALPEPV